VQGDLLATAYEAIVRLSAARDTGGWKEVLRVLAEQWDVLYRDHPAELLQTLDAMSEEVLDREPRLRLGRRDLRRRYETPVDSIIPSPVTGPPVDHLAALTDQVMAARSMGRLAVSVRRTDDAVAYFQSLPDDQFPSLHRALPGFKYQWGTTFVQAGRFTDAQTQFSEALELAQALDNRRMIATSAGAAALIHALHGRDRDAEALLRQIPPMRGDEWWAMPVPGLIADAWLHVDRFDYTRAANLISRVDITRAVAYWVPYFVTRTYLAAAGQESRQALLAEFDTFIDSLPAGGLAAPAHAEAISIVRHILLLHMHRRGQALRELEHEAVSSRADVFHQLGATIYARHLITAGRPAQASKLIRPLLNLPSSQPRILIRALLIAAETDSSDRADEFLSRAAELARWHRHYSPFLRSPPEIRHRVADFLTDTGDQEIADRVRALPAGERDSGAETLTDKETAVVEFALIGLTNAEIAGRLHISPNTVKSHLRSSYSKLGVTNRNQLGDRLGSDW
jgi:ATP/maltotriose-dependent transcriptional regulator MalT